MDLSKVKEVFIDATYNTSRMAMHLYAIIAEELGYGIAIGYMFVEVHHREDTKSTNHARESLECNRNFFKAAKDLGVKPLYVHLDKDYSEISAAQVKFDISRC